MRSSSISIALTIYSLPLMALVALLLPISGYRHLWQDEVETAERAKSILAYGVPRVIDPGGQLSLNAGGREIEESTLHRYTPWGQFYAGALGLWLGEPLSVSHDASIRLPFIIAHGMSSSLVTYGLVTFLGLPTVPALGIGFALGLQSVRILHNRTCRYHALLDFFLITGMIGLGHCGRGRKRLGSLLLGLSIFILPQIHTLGGSLLASLLILTAVVSSLTRATSERDWKTAPSIFMSAIRENLRRAVIPGFLSLILILVLTRPWLQSAWSPEQGPHEFRSIRSGFEIAYAFYIYVAAIIFLLTHRCRRLGIGLTIILAYVVVASRLLDLHPFSQTRYYLSLPLFFLFWPLALHLPVQRRPHYAWTAAILMLGVSLPELQGVIRPWQGLRITITDWQLASINEQQPLRKAFAFIKANSDHAPILIDYVPQLANWYLPEWPIALMPDMATITKLNLDNPIWQKSLIDPEWHLAYLTSYNGQWNCSPDCDAHTIGYEPGTQADRYMLSSKRLGRNFEMCIVARWKTARWNNAPFIEYQPESLNSEGPHHDELTLARRCK